MKTKVKKLRFIAKIAQRIACLTALFALSASAEDTRTLGYATSGTAAALPAAPDMSGAVVNVTAAQAQYVLDGAYGSIDGKTINFTESVADTLVLGRASKYEGSGTLYRHGSHDGEAMSYADFIAYKNQATWTEGCYYERTVANVTFTADAGVIVNFTAEGGAHVYGTESAPVYDYVRDTGTWTFDTNNGFYKRAILKNITFKGLTFKAKTDFNTSEATSVFDGFTFTGCTFEIGSTAAGNYALRYYDEYNNGNVRNLVVENCTFRNCYQGVYTHHVKGITVKDSAFETTGHNAIAIQSQGGEKGACDHGAVVITGNTFKDIGDRIIRFNMVDAGTTITIADNTADGNSGRVDSATGTREIVKAESLPENVAEIISASNNDWGANAVAGGVFADAEPVVTGVTVSGIAGFENKSFESFAAAYAAIKPTIEKLGLGQEGATAEQFDALFTAVDATGDATVTYTISGNVIYDETGCENLLSMGRKASHYGNGRHLINFNFVGKTGRDADTLTVNSSLTLPYEWWGEKKVTGIHFKNLTLTGSAPDGLYAYQSYFEGIDFSVANCMLKGLKIYNYSNVPGSYSITDSVLDGTGAPANSYAIHLQGNETAPLAITISGNTITGYDRGINIDQKTAVATISGNTISVNDAGRSCVQLTQLAETTVSGNTLNLTGGNAITLHEQLLALAVAPKISVAGNTIKGNGYLVYDDAAANGKAFTADNLALSYGTDNTVAETVDTTKGVKGSTVVSTSVAVNNVIQHYVATVGEAGYSTLADALAAAKDGETVTLLADVTEDVTVATSVTLDLGGKTLTNAGAGKVTLTIAEGKTVTVKNGSIVGGASNYTIRNNGTATFEDVTATAGNVGSSMLDNFGTLTINSGTYVGGMNTVKNEPKATLTVNGGTFENSYGENNNHTGVIYNLGHVAITGGELTQKATGPLWAGPHVVMTDWDGSNKPSVTITGGTFTSVWTSYRATVINDAGNGTAGCTAVSGGTFNKKVPENYCAAGFIPTANDDGTYGVKKGAFVAAIGDKKYESVDAAMESAAANETATTVKLLADSVDETIVPTWYIKGDVTIDADSAVKATFAPIEDAADSADNDGMAYIASYDAGNVRIITVGENVTLSFPNTAKKKGAFYVGYGKNSDGTGANIPTRLVLNGRIEAYEPYVCSDSSLTISKTGSLKSLSEDLITRYGSTMTVTGTDGAWSAANPQVALGYSSQQGGEVTFKDTFVTGGEHWTMWNRDGKADVATKLTLDNTTFTAKAFMGAAKSRGETSAYQVELKNGAKMTIEGDFAVIAEGAVTIEAGSLLTAKSISNAGTLTVRADALTEAVKVVDYTGMGAMTLADYGTVKAEGGELYVEDNDLWIRRPAVATIGEVRYETLADALAAAKKGDTVTLLADIVVEGPNGTSYNVMAGVTLDLNGHSVDGTSVGLDRMNPAALGLNVEGEGVIALVNTAATTAQISGYVPFLVSSPYSDSLKVEIGDKIELLATAGGTGNGVQLDSSVYLAYGDKTAALFKNGGFKVVVGGEARIYTSFDSASDKADDTTAVLLNDYTGDQPIKVMKYGKGHTAFTLDLDGHSYTYTGGNTYGIVNLNCAKALTVKNGTLADNAPSAGRREAGVKLEATGAKVTLETVVVETTGSYGVATSGSNKENDVTLVGTTIRAANGVGVYFPSTGTLTIDGGAITGLTGVQVCAGRLLVTGEPTITATGAGQADIPSSGAVLDGAAVSVVIRAGYGAVEGVSISGGQFTSAAGVEALQVYAVNGTEMTEWAEAAEKVSVSGGTFSTAVPLDYCAAGFIPTANGDGTFGVKEGAYVAEIGTAKYETLEAALAAAKDGETVKMLADAELTAAQTISQTLVLDLNGKAIRSAVDKFLVITKGGDLTVNDATNEGRIENTAAAFWARTLEMKGGVLTVNGGTIAANKATSSSSQTIIVSVGSPSTINLAGGRIEAIRTANHAQGVIELGTYANATLNVMGGEIVGSGTGIRSLAGNAVNVSSGTIVGQTGNAVYSSKASVLTITGGSIESKGASIAFGMGSGNSAVTIGREGGSASDVIIPSMDFDGRVVTVNLLSGTVKEFRNWTSMTVEKVSQGAATLLVGTDISTKLPGSDLLCQKDAASGLHEVVKMTVENAAATVLHDGVETPYNTVDQARRAVADGDTLTLKVDHTGSLAFTAQNVTVDLGGKTLTGASNSPALSFNQSATADNRVTVKNGTIIAKGQDAACIRATSGDAAQTLTVVLGDGLTLTAGSNNRSGRVVLDKGARTAAPCADVNNGGLLVTEDGKDWIYGETETAFTHANGAEVTLQNDWYSVDYDGTIKVPETAAFASAKLNLGGHTVKAYGGAAIVMGNDAKPAEGTAAKSLEISNGEVLTSSHGAAVCGSNKTLVFDSVKLTTTGDGKLGLYVNGTTRGNAVTLKNGSALTASGTGIYFPGAGTLTVVDSAVTGAKSGIEIRAGILNVSGTSAIASTATAFSFENNGSGVTTTGAAVAAVKHTVGNDLTVNIAGGTFKGPRGFYANDPNPTKVGKVTVAISGGTFSTAVLPEYCAEGYEPVTNADGTYGVKATFEIITVKTAVGAETTISVRIPNALMETVAGETRAEKVENLSKADANGNLAWVNLVAGIDPAKKVTMIAPQNDDADMIGVKLPAVGATPEGTDMAVRYEIHADGSEAAVASATVAEDLAINLNGKSGIGTYRAYVCLLQNGMEVARVASENALGVLQTVSAAKKTIIAVPWLSLTDGNAIAVADLVKTAGLTAGDKLHVYNKAESRYDVYELAADRAWTPKAIYKVGADGTVEAVSSGTPETTTVARGNGVWLERQDTTKPIVSYGQVASGTVATTIDAGTAEKPTWNLLAVPTTTAVNIAATFGASEADTLIVPTAGAPKICTVKDGAWGYAKSVPVTELPAGTGFWYLNGGAAKTVNW